MPSYQQHGQCYATAKDAAAAWIAHYTPITNTPSSGCFIVPLPTLTGTTDVPTVTFKFTRLAGTCPVPVDAVMTYHPVACTGVDQPTTLGLLGWSTETVTASFAWGFGAVMLVWGLAYAIGAARRVIKFV
jgi:hypothetical protein